MNSLANAYLAAARTTDATSLLDRSLQLSKEKFGPDHPSTLRAMSTLAVAYREAGRTSDALVLMQETAQLLEKKFGPNHPKTLTAMNNLAMFHRDTGDLKQSLASLEDILSRRRDANPDSVDVAVTLACMGDCLLRQKRYTDAEKALREAVEIVDRIQQDRWVGFSAQIALGQTLMMQRKFAEAETMLLAGYEGMRSQEKVDLLEATRSMTYACNALINIYQATDRAEKAAEWREKRAELNQGLKR
jgi:tetratricopeptide (TPR) repeat protein